MPTETVKNLNLGEISKMATETRSLTDAEQRFIELDRQKAIHRQFFKDLNAAAEAVEVESGLDHAFQDDQGIVYQVVKPSGVYVEYRSSEIHHTRREGESKGSLAVVAAKELGFEPVIPPRPKQAEKLAAEVAA